MVTQCFPLVTDTDSLIVKQFKEALLYSCPECQPTSVSLEGYIAGALVVELFTRVGPLTDGVLLQEITRQIGLDGHPTSRVREAGSTDSETLGNLIRLRGRALAAVRSLMVLEFFNLGVFQLGDLRLGPFNSGDLFCSQVDELQQELQSLGYWNQKLDWCMPDGTAPCNQVKFLF